MSMMATQKKVPFSVQYVKMDDIIDEIMLHSRGTLMAKFDVESTNSYCNVPVNSDDRYLLGKWRGKYFFDVALSFGLRSAPLIFLSIADMPEWILKHNYGMNFLLLHYLDDLIHWALLTHLFARTILIYMCVK